MTGKSIILSAPSGSGKTTVARHLLEAGLNLSFSVSACSRPPRPGEVDGKDYFFMGVEEFRNRLANDEFIEWEEVYPDQYYGTLKSELERIWNRQRHVIFDVDVVGGMNLKKAFGNNALAVFVQAPSPDVLEKRLRERSSDPEEKIQTRIAKAESEMQYADRFDVILVNDRLEDTLRKAEELVRAFLPA
jgi:guanylate kinase